MLISDALKFPATEFDLTDNWCVSLEKRYRPAKFNHVFTIAWHVTEMINANITLLHEIIPVEIKDYIIILFLYVDTHFKPTDMFSELRHWMRTPIEWSTRPIHIYNSFVEGATSIVKATFESINNQKILFCSPVKVNIVNNSFPINGCGDLLIGITFDEDKIPEREWIISLGTIEVKWKFNSYFIMDGLKIYYPTAIPVIPVIALRFVRMSACVDSDEIGDAKLIFMHLDREIRDTVASAKPNILSDIDDKESFVANSGLLNDLIRG